MRESVLVAMHTTINKQGEALQQVVLPGLRDVSVNESVTRRRVTKAEDRLDALELLVLAGFWARLRWVLVGTLPMGKTLNGSDETQIGVDTGIAFPEPSGTVEAT